MAAQRVDRLGPLTHQQIACPEQHPPTLLLRRLDRHKIHRRARRCLADRLSVRRIVLLTLDVRLDILRRDQPHRMAQIADLPAPVMSAGAGLHRHRAARLRCQKFQYFPAAQLLAERNRSIGPRAVQLKAVLRQINSDHANLVHGRPFPLLALTPLPTWHIAMPSGGASTPSLSNYRLTLRRTPVCVREGVGQQTGLACSLLCAHVAVEPTPPCRAERASGPGLPRYGHEPRCCRRASCAAPPRQGSRRSPQRCMCSFSRS